MKKLLLIGLIFLAAGCGKTIAPNTPSPIATPSPTSSEAPSPVPTSTMMIEEPISNALTRVTKKSFGTYVNPQNSPVSPEVFTGFHTAVDFETGEDEKDIDVPIYAICDGKLLQKRSVTGYGGMIVQSCLVNNEPVTVIYGHLRLSSISLKSGDAVKAGDQLAVLGTGYSSETSNERKHLHLGIHKGTAINILGYVQNKKDLAFWLDPLTLLK